MVGWHHQLNGHEFEQTLGDSEGRGSLMCCSPWGHKELDTSSPEMVNMTKVIQRGSKEESPKRSLQRGSDLVTEKQ